ncbi:MAG: succinate dehydrogenase cytochrome b subunit [Deltaproteobacteria bacterium]|nr:MAG: succinate dehydrogenase cytochrome b subunit [Deltaproteobacteria bacterium]TMQ07717.1 MAG: succinate dehydrogenase cytochrome b subunit [Deltaproteobacteria bacterium]
MSWFAGYIRSSIGAKQVMAVTGLLLLLFAIVHMLGHLQMFGGQDMYNRYAHFLQDLWEVKWPVRAGLLGLLIVHVVVAIGLVAKNRAARPAGYVKFRPVTSSWVGRTMAWTGLFVFAFLAFHILHFTLGQVQPGYFHVMDPKDRWDAYSMFIHGFQSPAVYAVYLVGILLLALHLGHGAVSWLQSLGLRHPKYPTDRLGTTVAALLFVGYMVPPTAVLAGILRLPGS